VALALTETLLVDSTWAETSFLLERKIPLSKVRDRSTISQSISSAIACLWPSSKMTPWRLSIRGDDYRAIARMPLGSLVAFRNPTRLAAFSSTMALQSGTWSCVPTQTTCSWTKNASACTSAVGMAIWMFSTPRRMPTGA
jgi:hypothetical protein